MRHVSQESNGILISRLIFVGRHVVSRQALATITGRQRRSAARAFLFCP